MASADPRGLGHGEAGHEISILTVIPSALLSSPRGSQADTAWTPHRPQPSGSLSNSLSSQSVWQREAAAAPCGL